ncbi:hypothetical protein [Mesorhizobium sp. M1027]|uniref:hypothetical protein n=1 Tax=Mesorhizobium sp. M1027 TaxID=2957050 RepID=UPI003335BF53
MTTLGILLCAFSMWTMMTNVGDAQATIASIHAGEDALNMRAHNLMTRLDEMDRQLGQPNVDAADARRRLDEARNESEAILTEWTKVLNEQRAGVASVKTALMSASIFTFGFWFGLIVAFVGGWLWYLNFQRYQDQIVRRQAAEAVLKSAS